MRHRKLKKAGTRKEHKLEHIFEEIQNIDNAQGSLSSSVGAHDDSSLINEAITVSATISLEHRGNEFEAERKVLERNISSTPEAAVENLLQKSIAAEEVETQIIDVFAHRIKIEPHVEFNNLQLFNEIIEEEPTTGVYEEDYELPEIMEEEEAFATTQVMQLETDPFDPVLHNSTQMVSMEGNEANTVLPEDSGETILDNLDHCQVLGNMDNHVNITQYNYFTAEHYSSDVFDQQYSMEYQASDVRIRNINDLREVQDNGVSEMANDEDSINFPFKCKLCVAKFKKKLYLNNHIERRHGIKYVFTEKGKKVKLIRMPEEHIEGEKLDPCVEVLFQANGQNSANILGVQTVEQKKLAETYSTAHEVDPCDLLQTKTDREFGAGYLVNTIRTLPMKTAQERKQTPFVAYRPLRSKLLYLLSINSLNRTSQLLFPATARDLESSEGVEKERSFYLTHSRLNSEQSSSPSQVQKQVVCKPCNRFSNVAIVALAEQVLDDEQNINVNVTTPPNPLGPVSLITPVHFECTVIRCRPKRLRCLSIPPQPVCQPTNDEIDTSRAKRKYTKRHTYNKKNKRGKRKAKQRKAKSSDDDSEFDCPFDTSSSEEEETIPRLTRVRTPETESPSRDGDFTTPARLHPFHNEILAPPKRKYTSRGCGGRRHKKSPSKELTYQMKRIRLETNNVSENGNPETTMNCDKIFAPLRPRNRKGRKHILQRHSLENTEDGNEGDKEDEERENSRYEVHSSTPVKKRGRGRPRKIAL